MFERTLIAGIALAAVTSVNATDLSLEPCINGAVSGSGNFPTQTMEEQVYAYLDWRSNEPYYLFAVAANYIRTPFEDSALKADQR